MQRDDSFSQNPIKRLKSKDRPENQEQVLTEISMPISRQEHKNTIDNAEKDMENCTLWERYHKNAVEGELHEGHILYTKQMLDKANAK